MSLYKDASLVMLPSAYKDGKLYSIRPTDGSGDFTFSRGSNLSATRVNASQLIEKGRENLILQSNQFDNAYWTKSASTITTGQADPNGASNAFKIVEDTSTNYHRISGGYTMVSGNVYATSVTAKAAGRDYLTLSNNVSSGTTIFNLTNGNVEVQESGVVSASTTSLGGGWYRCEMVAVGNASGAKSVFIGADNNGVIGTYTGDGISGVLIYQSQLESSLVATPYIETGASTAQAGILENTPRLDYSGGASCPSLLLEPSRTNLIPQSEYFSAVPTGLQSWNYTDATIINNSTISPQGVNNAAKLIEGSSNSRHSVWTNQSTTSSNNTISVFFKKGTRRYASILTSDTTTWNTMVVVDLEEGIITSVFNKSGYVSVDKIENYGNGWYRVTSSINGAYSGNVLYSRFNIQNSATPSPPPSNGYQGNGTDYIYIFGAQLEVNASYATSYIPTYGVSQTRSNDSGVLTSLPDSLADNYTIFLELERMVPRLTNAVDMFSFFGSGSSRIRVMSHNPDYFRVRFYAADGSSSGSLYETSGDFAQGNNYKAAIVYSNGTFKCFANGSLFGTLDAVIDVSSSYLRTECIAKQVLTFPTALTDSEAIALTTI